MDQVAKRRAAWALIAVMGVGTAGLAGCTSTGMEKDSDHGWLSGYQADKNNDGMLSQDEVGEAFSAADKNGDGSLDAGERGGGR